jgi:hypothetical protein
MKPDRKTAVSSGSKRLHKTPGYIDRDVDSPAILCSIFSHNPNINTKLKTAM